MIFYKRKKMRKSLCSKERKVKMKKTVLRAAAIAAVLAMAGSASGCYFFPEEEKLLDPPVLKAEGRPFTDLFAVFAEHTVRSSFSVRKIGAVTPLLFLAVRLVKAQYKIFKRSYGRQTFIHIAFK